MAIKSIEIIKPATINMILIITIITLMVLKSYHIGYHNCRRIIIILVVIKIRTIMNPNISKTIFHCYDDVHIAVHNPSLTTLTIVI